MSFPFTPNLQDEKFESLQTQYEYLKLLRLRHLQWMNSADDADTRRTHKEAARLIEELSARYNHLFNTLRH